MGVDLVTTRSDTTPETSGKKELISTRSGHGFVATVSDTGGGGGGGGAKKEAEKKVCAPKIGLRLRTPLINFFFCLRTSFLMGWGGGGGFRRRTPGCQPPPPPVSHGLHPLDDGMKHRCGVRDGCQRSRDPGPVVYDFGSSHFFETTIFLNHEVT